MVGRPRKVAAALHGPKSLPRPLTKSASGACDAPTLLQGMDGMGSPPTPDTRAGYYQTIRLSFDAEWHRLLAETTKRRKR